MSNDCKSLLQNAAEEALKHLAERDADQRTIALQLRMTGRLALKELRHQQRSPKLKLVESRQP